MLIMILIVIDNVTNNNHENDNDNDNITAPRERLRREDSPQKPGPVAIRHYYHHDYRLFLSYEYIHC